jgi:hypothetical protein
VSKSSALHVSSGGGFEMVSLDSGSLHAAETWEDPLLWHPIQGMPIQPQNEEVYGRSSRANSVDDRLLGGPQVENKNHNGNDEPELSALHDDENPLLATVPDDDGEDDEDNEEEDNDDMYDSMEETSFGDEEEKVITATISKPGFVRALLDSAIPRDLGDSTIGLVKGDYNVEKKTLLHHAATSDQYDLFSPNRRRLKQKSDA